MLPYPCPVLLSFACLAVLRLGCLEMPELRRHEVVTGGIDETVRLRTRI